MKTDKMVEIAQFSYPSDAQTLMALLRSEGIECYLRNELTTQIMAGYADVGGARVEILEKDLPEALKIMQEGGYPLPQGNPEQSNPLIKWMNKVPLLKGKPVEKQLLYGLIILAALLALILYLGVFLNYYQTN